MAPQKKTAVACNVSKWYKADDVRPHFRRTTRKVNKPSLKSTLKPGQVCILLAGRFRGKRVVFLKQLESGLLLVTGPYKVNGVPLKRVNQAYVQVTSTRVDLTGVDASQVSDKLFERVSSSRKPANFFTRKQELADADKTRLDAKKKAQYAQQVSVDRQLLANIKKVDMLRKYLSSRFSLSRGQRPHEMRF